MRVLANTLALGGLLLLAGPTAQAQTDDLDEEARALFVAGRVAFDAGRYEDALEHFNNAYARSRRPRLLYNVGLAAERAGRLPLAIRAYSKFLDAVEDSPHRATVESRLAALRAQGAARPTPASTFPDAVTTPAPTSTAVRDTAPAAPQPHAQSMDRPMTESPSRVGPIVTIAGGAVLAVGGLTLIGLSFPAKAEAEDEIMWPRANDANQRARRRSGSGIVLGTVGVLAALAGVVWLKVAANASYGLTLGPTRIGIEGRF